MITQFKTVAKPGQGAFKDRGSKFLSFAFNVNDETSVRACLDQLRKDYFDARHHCYAYVMGVDKAQVRANDDGEPNHSAGDPILGQIHSYDLTDTLVVVIRYFGGTKLGVSGLINAYRSAAQLALYDAMLVTEFVKAEIQILYGYQSTANVMRLIDEFTIEIVEQKFEESCHLKGKVVIDKVQDLEDRIQFLNDTGSSILLKSWQ